MPRQPRIDLPGYVYHVIIRGIEKRKIYLDKLDYQEYLKRFGNILANTQGKCFAWSLLPNHAHMLIQSGHKGLAHMMRRLLTGYAVYFNQRHKRVGHLFQNRYKATLCDSDEYLHTLVRYIHLNPLKAGIVQNLEELGRYQWTGDHILMGKERCEWQDVDAVLGLFGQKEKEAKLGYRDFLRKGLELKENYEGGGLLRSGGGMGGVLAMRSAGIMEMSDERILAGGEFVNSVYDCFEKRPVLNEQGAKQRKSIEVVIQTISACMSINEGEITRRSQNRRLVLARTLVAQHAQVVYGYTATEIGKALRLSVSGVSRLLGKRLGDEGKKIVEDISRRLA